MDHSRTPNAAARDGLVVVWARRTDAAALNAVIAARLGCERKTVDNALQRIRRKPRRAVHEPPIRDAT